MLQKAHLRSWYLIFLFLLVISPEAKAQGGSSDKVIHPPYIQYGISDGLTSLFVSDLYNDRNGLLWISTSNGVCTFNGRTFERIPSGGLINDFVLCVKEDLSGTMWCRTMDGRIYALRNNAWHPHLMNDTLQRLTLTNRVTGRLAFDSLGNIYTDYARETVKISNTEVTSVLRNLHQSKIGRLVTFEGELMGAIGVQKPSEEPCFIQVESGKYVYTFPDVYDFEYMETRTFTMRAGSNNLFVRGDRLFGASPTLQYSAKLPSAATNSFCMDDQGHVWIGTEFAGALAYADSSVLHQIFPDKKVTAIIQDFEGGYWFGIDNEGLRYVPTLYASIRPKQKTAKGYLKVHAFDNALYTIDELGTIFKNDTLYSRLDRGHIYRVFPVTFKRDSTLILGVRDSTLSASVVVKNLKSNTSQTFNTDHLFRKAHIMNEDTLLLTYTFITSGLRGPRVTSRDFLGVSDIVPLQGDTALIALQRGVRQVVFVNPRKGIIPIINEYETTLRFSHLNQLGAHIICFSPGNTPFRFDPRTSEFDACKNLPKISTKATLNLGPDTVLAGSENGLFMLLSIPGQGFTAINLTQALGLPEDRINDITRLSDSIILALPNELLSLNMSVLRQLNPRHGKVFLSGVKVNGLPRGNGPELPEIHSSDHIQMHVAAISYKLRNEFQYEYRLLPLDTHWNSGAQSFIDFFGLPAGAYTFQLRNQEAMVESRFEISQFFYQETWFLVLAIMLLTALLFTPIYLRQRLRHTHLRLEREKEQLQLQSLTNQLKPHFVFNALSSIQSFILDNDPLKSSEYLSQFAQHIRNALTSSLSETISLEQAVVATENYLLLESMRFNGAFTFNINVGSGIDTAKTIMPVMLLQPYVENAVIHGMTNINYPGHIQIDFALQSSQNIQCTIHDNGAGLDSDNQEQAHQGNGLGTSINRQRIRLINSLRKQQFDVNIEANKDAPGVTVTIQIPMSYD